LIEPQVALSAIAAVFTLTGLWLTGNRSLAAPIIGMINFIPWTLFAYVTEAWPLIPMNMVITMLHLRTFIKWRRHGSSTI
jgi:hypothetical protein